MALFGRKKTQAEPVVVDAPVETLPEPPAARPDGLRDAAAHREYLLSLVEPLPAFGMRMLDAVGLRLYEDLEATQDLPSRDSARIEGYAVRASDVAGASDEHPVVLPLAGAIGIGEEATGTTEPGECVRLVSGAPLPAGTDAVVPLAQADEDGDDVTIRLAVEPGDHVSRRGTDVADGETLLSEGERLDARAVGRLAAAGIDRVMARPRPRVVVVAVGSELVEPGQALPRDAATYDTNSYLLAAAARDLGADVYRVGVYTDDPARLKEAITDQLIRADLVITTGGVSRDDHDLVRSAVPDLGQTDFTRVAMTPGSAQGFGLVGPDRVPMVMLPGNLINAYVSFQVFVRPLLRKLMGITPHVEPLRRALLTGDVAATPGQVTWVRGHAHESEQNLVVDPFTNRSAHQLGDLARANCLIRVTDDLVAGDRAEVLLLDQE